MQLKATSSNYVQPPEGIHQAVCVDVIDLGMVESFYKGQRKVLPKVRLVFELEAKMEDGKPFSCGKAYTASLHPKSNLAKFIGKWRGRPVAENETIDMEKLIGSSATLVLGKWTSEDGQKSGVGIDAVSKPSKKLAPSGHYDPKAARQRIAEYNAKKGAPAPQTSSTAPRPANKHAAPADDDVHMGDAPAGTESDVGF